MQIFGNRIRFRIPVTGIFFILFLSTSVALNAYPVGRVPNPPSVDLNKAVALLAKGNLKEADAVFQEILGRDSGQLDALLGRAQIAASEHQLDSADQMVATVLKRSPTLPEAHNMKGVILLLRKDNDGARREFSRAIELQPKYVTPYLYLAVLARTSGDYPRAAEEYKALTQVAPHLPAGYLGEAEALTMQHREADALKVLESWKSGDPKTLLPYQVIASVNLSDHKPADAIHQLQGALAKSPHDSPTLTLLGTAYLATGDTRAASAQYQAALTSNPANTDAAIRLGNLEAAARQNDRALVHFRMAVKADPNNAIACNNVAWLLADQGKDLDEALRLAASAVTLDPKYTDARDTLGWVQYRRGEYAAAVTTLKAAKALAPANTDIAAHLGLAYAKAGHKPEALAELKRALAPGSTVANRAELERTVTQLSAAK